MKKKMFVVPFENGSGEKAYAIIFARRLNDALKKARKFAEDFDMRVFFAEIKRGEQ